MSSIDTKKIRHTAKAVCRIFLRKNSMLLSIIRFVDICANGCACSCKLIGHISTFRCSYTVNKIYDGNSKFKR